MPEHSARRPSPLSLAVLGLLHERPMHPYEIAYEMKVRHLEEQIKLNVGTLYHTVELLQAAGWIEPLEHGRLGGRPERTVYRLTDTGAGAFVERLSQLLAEPAREYSEFEAGLAFIERLGRDEGLRLLNERLGRLEDAVGEKRERLAQALNRGLPRLWLIENEHAVRMLEAELVWLRGICDDIASGRLEWKSATDDFVDHRGGAARRDLVKGAK